jgi:hypothetical protein
MIKGLLLIALLGTLKPTASITVYGRAPFCLVDSGGFIAQCYYYSMSSCRMAIFNNEFCLMR